MSSDAGTRSRIKHLIVDSLRLEGMEADSIEDDVPLFGEAGIGLDSIDALELVVALEQEFGIQIPSEDIGNEVFASVSTLAEFVAGRLAEASPQSVDG